MHKKTLLASLLMVAAALGATAAGAADEAAKLNKLYGEFWEENLKLNPLLATGAGDPRYNAELPNFLSAEREREMREFHEKYLKAAKRKLGSSALDRKRT